MTPPQILNALISVSDKTGLVEFAQSLCSLGVTLYASGGTRRHLEDADIHIKEVSAYTGFPEMMEGRVKTLHPKIHGGILCRRDSHSDKSAMDQHGIVPFDLVAVNLYPFAQTVARQGVTIGEAIEEIDIGGPTLIRGAAKNHAFVTVVCDPAQYDEILAQITSTGWTSPELRRDLATAAFAHTAAYDAAIAEYFAGLQRAEGHWPNHLTSQLRLQRKLRYGENPHQQAAVYTSARFEPGSLVTAEQLHGKELSFNNLLDLNAAVAVARSLPVPGVSVLKHTNPCGAATAVSLREAMERAWEGDPTSAFGSVLGFNCVVDGPTAEYLAEPGRFVEAIVAPDFSPQAVEVLTSKPKWKSNVRLIKVGRFEPGRAGVEVRSIDGGYLVQEADDLPDHAQEWRVVTQAQPGDEQWTDLRFAWAVCRNVKSNAIALVRDNALVGVGAGQMSRVDAVEIAIRKAAARAKGAVLASDAFFPFDDSIDAAAEAGIAAIIQPGGSRRDDEVIAACDRHRLPMIFTSRRHFRH